MTEETPPPAGSPPASATPPVHTPMASVRLGIGSAIFQGALVVLGVVLGFLITEWQSDAAQRGEAKLALASILEEISANHAAVTEAHDYHTAKIAMMTAATRDKTTLDMRNFDRGFIAPAQVSGAAWTTAGETGALTHLPFDHVLALSRVYAQQGAYQQQQATASNLIYATMFEGGLGGILEHAAGLRAVLTTFQYREQQLADAYRQALADIRPEGDQRH